MRGLWQTCLALALALPATAVGGGEGLWHAPDRPGPAGTAAAPTPGPGPGQPIARAGPPPAAPVTPAAGRAPAASLDRPVPIATAGPVVDAQVRPTSFSREADPLAPTVVRGLAPDGPALRAMPVGPPIAQGPPVTTWERAETPPPTPAAPMAAAPFPGGPPLTHGGPGQPFMPLAPGCCPDCVMPCGPCCDSCCCDGGCCPPGNLFYGSAEYLLWFVRGSPVPPLVTTGVATDQRPGAIGQPGTMVLFGGKPLGEDARSGVRASVGYWLNEDHVLGIEVGGFVLGDQNDNFSALSFGNPILARPFTDVATVPGTSTPDPTRVGSSIQGIAAPGRSAGDINIHHTSSFYGYEANLRSNVCCGCNYYVDFILGYRGLALDESLSISETVLDLRPGTTGNTFNVNDSFAAHNRFNGGQTDFEAELRRGRWYLDMKAKVALGGTQQTVDIAGSSSMVTAQLGAQSFPGHGLLAQPTNSGHFSRDTFTVVPELGLNLGYQFTDHVRAFVGYNFIYWSSVVRPGNQIDPIVNSNQVAPPVAGGPSRPQFQFNGSEFWAHGITLGLEFRY